MQSSSFSHIASSFDMCTGQRGVHVHGPLFEPLDGEASIGVERMHTKEGTYSFCSAISFHFSISSSHAVPCMFPRTAVLSFCQMQDRSQFGYTLFSTHSQWFIRLIVRRANGALRCKHNFHLRCYRDKIGMKDHRSLSQISTGPLATPSHQRHRQHRPRPGTLGTACLCRLPPAGPAQQLLPQPLQSRPRLPLHSMDLL